MAFKSPVLIPLKTPKSLSGTLRPIRCISLYTQSGKTSRNTSYKSETPKTILTFFQKSVYFYPEIIYNVFIKLIKNMEEIMEIKYLFRINKVSGKKIYKVRNIPTWLQNWEIKNLAKKFRKNNPENCEFCHDTKIIYIKSGLMDCESTCNYCH